MSEKAMIKRIARKIQHEMQQNYLTFRLWVWMDQWGITRRISLWIRYVENKKLRKKPSKQMIKRQEFYERNRGRVINFMSMLADEKSRMVWGGGNRLSNKTHTS